VANCSASGNGGGGIVVGIGFQTGATVLNCVATANSVAGIIAGTNCLVANCTASKNLGDGIQFGGKCVIKDNNASSNTGNGFRVTGSGVGAANRIDGNTAVSNGANGIFWANDLVVRNSCFLNGVNYSPAVGGGNTGPVQAASSATNPWANF
jgi:parallel beta-helix repeat protein